MSSESFNARPAPHWLLVTGLVIGPIVLGAVALGLFLYPSWFMGSLFALCTWALADAVRDWRNRSRPVLEITDEEIRFARWFWPQLRCVPRREVEAIEVSGERRAVIRLRSGKRRVVWTWFVEPSSRSAAVAALERVSRMESSPI